MTGRRALLLTTDFPPQGGGIARLLGEIVGNSRDEVDWRVVAVGTGPATPGVTRARGQRGLARAVASEIGWVRRERRTARPLVVCGHVHLLGHAVAAAKLARADLATMVYGMEVLPSGGRRRLALRGLRFSDRVVAISRHSATVALRTGIAANRVRVVSPRLRPEWSATEPCPRRPRNGLRLVTVTRLAEGYKNVELLLRVVHVLKTARLVDCLTIVGDGPRRAALERKTQRLGVDDVVKFAGRLTDEEIGRVLGQADVGLFPSRDAIAEGGFEGFGLVIQEFAAAGLPVLVGAAAGAVEAMAPPWSIGLDPDDLRAWVDALEHLVSHPEDREEMARAATLWIQGIDSRATARLFVEALAP